ncbi:MAG: TonB-dependent receptor [Bacteroidales bacterium]|nr:TonB-dependent receptor [Bacteroidales bacterium]
MRFIHIILFLFLVMDVAAQQTISGTISDRKGNPVMNANIYFEGSYDGTTSDAEGSFALTTNLTGKQLLVASFIGYQRYTRELLLDRKDTAIVIVMKEQMSEINEAAITAGIFSASDKKKSATLTSFDIATTASAMGDIYGAYATMPGSQKVGEEGMLFVRGGDSYETKTYMDGMLVQSPFFSKMPDIPTRGRYSPLLFSETLFSTGGYSAEFGQALSSIVDLTTNDLEPDDKTSVSIMTVGANASMARRWENSSLALSGLYANNALHHKLFKQTVDWIKDPVMGDGTLMYRKRVGETGLLKAFCSYNYNAMQMNYDNFEEGTLDEIQMINHTLYANTSYTGELDEKWLVRSGIAYNKNFENITYKGDPVHTTNSASQFKLVLTNLTTKKMKIRMGGDVILEQYGQQIKVDSTIRLDLTNLQPSLFLESELKLSSKFALRMGARAEYGSLLEKLDLSPRFSAAYKTGTHSQVSLAYGKFHQKPGYDYLKMAPWLTAEKSDHYILNFQYKKNTRIFRIEAYMKQYNELVKFSEQYSTDPSNYNNNGSGYARGLDLFWRDRETVKGLDYWISYSYLDTKRDYKDYPARAVPGYASAHNLSLVCKYFFTRLNTFGGLTYSFAGPRPYDDKNSSEFMNGRTKAYNDISMNITYVTQLFKYDFIIHMNITNLFGFKNVYGYNYSSTPGEDGIYASQSIIPSIGRQAVLLVLISF